MKTIIRIMTLFAILASLSLLFGCGDKEVTPTPTPDNGNQPEATPDDSAPADDVDELGELINEDIEADDVDTMDDVEINPDDFFI